MVPSLSNKNCFPPNAEQSCNTTWDCTLTFATPRHLSALLANRKVKSSRVCGLATAACIVRIACAVEATERPSRAAIPHSSRTANARKQIFVFWLDGAKDCLPGAVSCNRGVPNVSDTLVAFDWEICCI